jgi:predicted membrane protein
MGGIDLDLRHATLDPAGAELKLKATMGGVQVLVPEDWAIHIDTEMLAGGFEVNVTPPEKLPEDAPKLRIHALARMGGGVVTTQAA